MVYSILLCLLVLLIYLSNRGNRTNRWCAISGFLFSLGPIKEYFYFDIVPRIPNAMINGAVQPFYTFVYSVMTALLYYLAMPTAIVFAMYFSGNWYAGGQKSVLCSRRFLGIIFIIPAVMALIYKPHLFREYQLSDQIFWYILSAYNLIYGGIFFVLIIRSVLKEHNPDVQRQKWLVSAIILPPIFYWLVTIFVIHPLGLRAYFKAWQGNVLIILLSVSLFLFMSFKEGIMGMKLRSEYYRWDSDMTQTRKSVQFTSHVFKNEAVKMSLCLNNLEQEFKALNPGSEIIPEFAIMHKSIEKQVSLLEKMRRHSEEIALSEQYCLLTELMEEAIRTASGTRKDVSFQMEADKNTILFCDRQHMLETLDNLLSNAADAVNKGGKVQLSCLPGNKHGYCLIQVRDNGQGIDSGNLDLIFDPYYTTKNNVRNFGLGLAYCRNVVQKHGGYIKAESKPGEGTTMTIALPVSRFSAETGALAFGK